MWSMSTTQRGALVGTQDSARFARFTREELQVKFVVAFSLYGAVVTKSISIPTELRGAHPIQGWDWSLSSPVSAAGNQTRLPPRKDL